MFMSTHSGAAQVPGRAGPAARGWAALILLGGVVGMAAPPGSAPAWGADAVQLNEVLADPARDWNQDGTVHSRDDEWVEIVNTGAATVTLDGYRLAGADTVWRHGFTGLLFPGETRVVFGGESYAWEQANGFPLFGLRLTNTGGTITLWKLGDVDTVMVDSYTYADHEAEDDRSSGRIPDGGQLWRLFDALNPYGGSTPPEGTGCTPSPGAPYLCPVPVKPGTWGSLKTRYLPPWS